MLETGFKGRKESIKLWLNGQIKSWHSLDELPLDKNIASLVHALNELPFIYTMGSCGGHVYAKDGYAVFHGSWFAFTIDGSQEGTCFVEELKVLIGKFEGTSCEILQTENKYAVVLARQPQNRETIALKEAEHKQRQTQELIEKIAQLIQTKNSL